MGKRIKEGRTINRLRETQYEDDYDTPYFVTRMLDYDIVGDEIKLVFADRSKVTIDATNNVVIDQVEYDKKGNGKTSLTAMQVKSFAVLFKEFFDYIIDDEKKFKFVSNLLEEFDGYNSAEVDSGYNSEDGDEDEYNDSNIDDEYGHYNKSVKSRSSDIFDGWVQRADTVRQGRVEGNKKVSISVNDLEHYDDIYDTINEYSRKLKFGGTVKTENDTIFVSQKLWNKIKSNFENDVNTGIITVDIDDEEYLFEGTKKKIKESKTSAVSDIDNFIEAYVRLVNTDWSQINETRANETLYPFDISFDELGIIEWLQAVKDELKPNLKVNKHIPVKRVQQKDRTVNQELESTSFQEQLGFDSESFSDEINIPVIRTENDEFTEQVLSSEPLNESINHVVGFGGANPIPVNGKLQESSTKEEFGIPAYLAEQGYR